MTSFTNPRLTASADRDGSASAFNLWCSINNKPYHLVRHVWPDGRVEWDVEMYPGKPDSTVAYGTGQQDEGLAVIAGYAFLSGIEWAEANARSVRESLDEDDGDAPDEAPPAALAPRPPVPVVAAPVVVAPLVVAPATPAPVDPAPIAEAPLAQPSIEIPPTPVLPAAVAPGGLPPVLRIVRAMEAAPEPDPEDGDVPATGSAVAAAASFELPPDTILRVPPANDQEHDELLLAENAKLLESVLRNFGVRGEIMEVRPGPVVTLYELEPAPGTKSARVIGLAEDVARSMSAIAVRIAIVPGRSVMGIELPNPTRETVFLREMLISDAYRKGGEKLPLILGKDIGGGPVVVDLARMPHLLIAGTTGSGKSVGINAMILSLLYALPPDKCRFIMIDPKMLELSVYDGIPHLLAPVVTDPKKAVVALKWAVREMEMRYQSMSKLGVRNIEGYNARVAEAQEKGEEITRKVQIGFDKNSGGPLFEEQRVDLKPLPYIVVVVDEMADLMLVAGKDIEAAIQRLAQMARAAGIHLIMATQRPSVDVITGTIKANFPTRISFQVTSKIDSRTILGEAGAEQLLGQGDMLYMAGGGRITRVHGPFVSDTEVEQVVAFLKSQGAPDYLDAITEDDDDDEDGPYEPESGSGGGGGSGDDLYDQAVALVARERKASVSFVQRHLQIGYNRAARLIERMEEEGVVGAANHVGKREVLARRAPSSVRRDYEDED
jgi:S-DNA-T family DNA segregation ATPase FtsK/SpoIIIE